MNKLLYKSRIDLVEQIKKGDQGAFKEAFEIFYPPLVNFARGLIGNKGIAEEQVQDVFVALWEKRNNLDAGRELFPYLVVSVRNRCINEYNHARVENKYRFEQKHLSELYENYDQLTEDRLKNLHAAIGNLPPECRRVFVMSKFDRKAHKQIASELNISTKTVESQITKAMKILRNQLKGNVVLFLSGIGSLLN
ncbi:MAG TPA: RNA polymerase sigma-70 factor [Chryseosolibacter sp.]